MKTGTLRQDIELIRPGAHGNYPMLFDPLSENYYRIDANTALMISKMDQNYEIDRFVERLNNAGLTVTEAEVIELVNFLRQNNLLAPEYGHIGIKRERQTERKEKRRFCVLPQPTSSSNCRRGGRNGSSKRSGRMSDGSPRSGPYGFSPFRRCSATC